MSDHYIIVPPNVFRDLVRALNARSVRRAPRVVRALSDLQCAVEDAEPDEDEADR